MAHRAHYFRHFQGRGLSSSNVSLQSTVACSTVTLQRTRYTTVIVCRGQHIIPAVAYMIMMKSKRPQS